MKRKYYPVFLNLRGKSCLVVGGGSVAGRKVKSLVNAGARVSVLSPAIAPEIQKLHEKKKIKWLKKYYLKGDAKGYQLVFCATNEKKINKTIRGDAAKNNALVNVADALSLCDFLVPASFQKGSLTVALSTDGKSPAFSAALKRKLQRDIPEEYAKFLDMIHKQRGEIKKALPDENQRTEFVLRLLQDNKILHFIRKGQFKTAENYLRKCHNENFLRGRKP